MAKLSNGTEYINIYFPVSHAEYLLSNGFKCTAILNMLHFAKDHIALYVKNDTLDMMIYQSDKNKWLPTQSHSGISELNHFNWIMLLQLMGAQKANHRSQIQKALP